MTDNDQIRADAGKDSGSRVIFLLCCLMVSSVTGIYANSYGVFYTSISAALGAGLGEVAVHATLASLVSSLTAIFTVRIFGKVPVKLIMTAGFLLVLVPGLILTFADRLLLFNVFGLIQGIGYGFFNIPVVAVISGLWFKKNRGAAMGVIFSFAGISGAIFAPLLTRLIVTIGFRHAYLSGDLLNESGQLVVCVQEAVVRRTYIAKRPILTVYIVFFILICSYSRIDSSVRQPSAKCYNRLTTRKEIGGMVTLGGTVEPLDTCDTYLIHLAFGKNKVFYLLLYCGCAHLLLSFLD